MDARGRRSSLTLQIAGPDAIRLGRGYQTAVSLHAHSSYSRESLDFLDDLVARVPLVRELTALEIHRYRRRSGHTVEFTRGYWHPPLPPAHVVRSEIEHIEATLGLPALVSLTDHDTLEGCHVLRSSGVDEGVPLSVEWTVPFGSTVLHLGLHNLAGQDEAMLVAARSAEAAGGRGHVVDVIRAIARRPDTLVVVNHPFWDIADAGAPAHMQGLDAFLARHGEAVHALEINGYRPRRENLAVKAMADARGLPVVGGGDRHGRAPNAVVNLSLAGSFAAFGQEVRDGRSTVVLLPAYLAPLQLRKLQVVADAVRTYESHPEGHRSWTDRVHYRIEEETLRLTEWWPDGAPGWLAAIVRTTTCTIDVAASMMAAVQGRRRALPGPALLDVP